MTTTGESRATADRTTCADALERLERDLHAWLVHRGTAVRVDLGSYLDPRDVQRRTFEAAKAEHTVTVRLAADGVIVAPTPGRPGPCPRCLDLRWVGSRFEHERQIVDDPHGVLLGPARLPGPSVVAAVGHLVEQAVHACTTHPTSRADYPIWRLLTMNTRIEKWGLLADPSCTTCGLVPPDSMGRARVRLTTTTVPELGAARSVTVEELGLPVDALANPVCGALGGPSVRAYHATASAPTSGRFIVRSKYGLHEMWWGGHSDSYARSELVGILEGLERRAGQFPTAYEAAVHAPRSALSGRVVEFESCGVYSDEFYRSHHDKYVRWDSDPSIPWVHGWSIRDDAPVLVPEQLVYYLDRREDHLNTVQECSNGCASGSSMSEAVLHGLLELLERDAFITSWYAPTTPAEIDLDTSRLPVVHHMRAQLDLLGYDLRCFDIRTDLPLPTVGSVAVRRDGGMGTLCFAGGAGLEPDEALRAAVCEVASYVPGFTERVEKKREFLEAAMEDLNLITELEQHPLLFGMPEMRAHAEHWMGQTSKTPMRDLYRDWAEVYQPSTDLTDPVRLIVRLLAERGMDTVVVDQTSPEQSLLGIHTVAVVVPGLVPIDFGWARQRALTMPRTYSAHFAGWRSPRPFRGGELTPYPHPFP